MCAGFSLRSFFSFFIQMPHAVIPMLDVDIGYLKGSIAWDSDQMREPKMNRIRWNVRRKRQRRIQLQKQLNKSRLSLTRCLKCVSQSNGEPKECAH